MPDDIKYPYMPADRHLKYVPADHEFMLAAKKAREERSSDPLFPVGIALVKDGQLVAVAGNGFNQGSGTPHICPRYVLGCPSGVGYELCHLHDPEGHAEPMVVAEATRLGIDTNGADAYMYGHWWACEPCWNALIAAGIRNLYVTDDAHERFSRDRVYAETLAGDRQDVRLESDGTTYRVYVPESSDPVYTFEAESPELAQKYFKNVVKQL